MNEVPERHTFLFKKRSGFPPTGWFDLGSCPIIRSSNLQVPAIKLSRILGRRGAFAARLRVAAR